MARRRRGSPSLSLFSFQDIITSVTGIVIFVVLVLSLELVESQQNDGGVVHSAYQELATHVQELQAEIIRIQKLASSKADLVKDLPKYTEPELQDDIQSLQFHIKESTSKLESLTIQFRSLTKVKSDLEEKKTELDLLLLKIKSMEREIETLSQKIKQEETSNKLFYSVPDAYRKTGWLVLLDGNSLHIAPLNQLTQSSTFQDLSRSQNQQSTVTNFMDWIESNNPEYLLIAIRPNAIDLFSLVSSELNDTNQKYGFDVIGATELPLTESAGETQ